MRIFNKNFISKYINSCPKTDDIRSWKKFHFDVRSRGCNLLSELHKFPKAVLIAGCQRSGTTILSRVITESEGMYNYWFGLDDELDAAQILSGYVKRESLGRYCFQTTYLNECFTEYYEKDNDFKLIWVIRNPLSVTYSMMFNWGRFAFNELFDDVGSTLLNGQEVNRYEKYGQFAISKIQKACLSYNAKISQIFTIMEKLGEDRVMVVDYDNLATNKQEILPCIYDFIQLSYRSEYASQIHEQSVAKADKLSENKRKYIKKVCFPVYEKAKKLIK